MTIEASGIPDGLILGGKYYQLACDVCDGRGRYRDGGGPWLDCHRCQGAGANPDLALVRRDRNWHGDACSGLDDEAHAQCGWSVSVGPRAWRTE